MLIMPTKNKIYKLNKDYKLPHLDNLLLIKSYFKNKKASRPSLQHEWKPAWIYLRHNSNYFYNYLRIVSIIT